MNIEFEKLSGNNIKIGIIDTGINSKIIKNIINAYKCDFTDYEDYIGHGTTVAQIISKLAPSSILYNIKVFDKNSYTSPLAVIEGIEWAISNKLDIINLSLGTKDFYYLDDFKEIIKKANKNNCIIVSAISNDYSFSLPAILENVICVGSSNNNISNRYGYYFIKNKYIQCVADGGQYKKSFSEKSIDNKNQTSYATPIISSIIAMILQLHKGLNYFQLLQILESNSLKKKPNLDYISNKIVYDTLLENYSTSFLDNKILSNSKKILFFPITTEKHFLNEYNDLLNVEVCNFDKRKPFSNEHDLFIISKSTLNINNKNLLLLEKLLEYNLNIGKSVYSLVPKKELNILINSKSIKRYRDIIFINDYIQFFINNSLQITPNNKTPVLALINLTHNQYNFFDFQLLLRRYFLLRKLNFTQISSVVFSPLFGFDFVLNFELLKSELLFSDFIHFISYLNNYYTSNKKTELTLYGFETTPFLSTKDVVEAEKNNLATLTFACLNSIQPDAFILYIDSNYSLEFLNKNIDSLLLNYNPDFIIIVMNMFFYYESNTGEVNGIYKFIKSKNNNSDCELIILDLTGKNFEENIYSTLIKHYQ